jgi:molecular chaperone DnaK
MVKPDFFPSVVQVTPNGDLVAGRSPSQPSDVLVSSVRSKIGSEWRFDWGNVSYGAEDFATALLTGLKRSAQLRLEREISKAVLTVPTSYNSAQRHLFKEAAENAGLEVIQLLNEPTAVALAHSYFFPEMEGNFLIYSLGAGSFAATVLSVSDGIIEIKSASGNSRLGSEDLDDSLLIWMIEEFEKQNQVPFEYNHESIGRLRRAAEQARIDLTTAPQAHIKVTKLFSSRATQGATSCRPYHLITSIDRQTFANLSANLVDETIRHVERALVESHLEREEINYLLFAGPPGNSPLIRAKLSDVVLHGHLSIIHSDDSWPALGAAIQASLLTNDLRDFVTWDVLSVPVGIELPDGKFKPLIARGTPLPVTAYHAFTSPDGTINASVVQGESEVAQENTPLAELTINNCPPTSSQETKVEIAFCVRQDGIVHYSARHVGLGVNLTLGVHQAGRVPHKSRQIEAKLAQESSVVVTDDAVQALESQYAAPVAKPVGGTLKQRFAAMRWIFHFKAARDLGKRYARNSCLRIQRYLKAPDQDSSPDSKNAPRTYIFVPRKHPELDC